MHTFRPHPRLTESEALGGWVEGSSLCFKKSSRWLWRTLKFENHWPIFTSHWQQQNTCGTAGIISAAVWLTAWAQMCIGGSSISALSLAICWEKREFAKGDHPDLLRHSAFLGAGDEIDNLVMDLCEHGAGRRNCQIWSTLPPPVLVMLDCAQTEHSLK